MPVPIPVLPIHVHTLSSKDVETPSLLQSKVTEDFMGLAACAAL